MMASVHRSAAGRSISLGSGKAPATPRSPLSPRVVKPCAATAKEFVEAISTIPGKMRVITLGDGAILEAVSPLGKAKYNDTPKGQLATFTNGDASFEVHIYLQMVSDAKVAKAKSKHGSHDTYSIRLFGLDKSSLVSFFLDGKAPDAESIKAWQEVQARFGEEVTFDFDEGGDAMFSFSDA